VTEFRLHGPPGTGKTRALAESWIPKAADRFGGERVLVCSLTKTAAAEVAGRTDAVPRHNVGTLHAHCFRALGTPTIAESKAGEWNALHPALALTGVGRPSIEEPDLDIDTRGGRGDELMARAQVLRHRLIPRDDWPEEVAGFQATWDAWKTQAGYLDFTDLIEHSLEAIERAPGDPAVLIVDEAQDSSALEIALVRRWGERADYFVLAGDGDQAIYGWRGAAASAFYGSEIPTERNYHLRQSWRVPRAVHHIATQWIAQCAHRYAVDYEPRDHDGQARSLRATASNPRELIDDIELKLAEGRSCMVLVSCAFMLDRFSRALRARGVAFHNPYRKSNGAWNPLRAAPRLVDFLRGSRRAFGDTQRTWTWRELQRWLDLVRSEGTLVRGAKAQINRHLVDAISAQTRTQAEDLVEIFDREALASLAVAMAGGADEVAWLEERALASKVRLIDYPGRVYKRGGVVALSAAPKLVVGTIHSVKGGEADVVYLAPDLSPAGMRHWLARGDERDSVVRTFYVGMTRAREELVLLGRASPNSLDLGKVA